MEKENPATVVTGLDPKGSKDQGCGVASRIPDIAKRRGWRKEGRRGWMNNSVHNLRSFSVPSL